MTEHIDENGSECCNDYTQEEYLGLWGCQREEQPIGFFRSLFQNRQFSTDQVRWDELKNQFANFMPAIMCDPCATAPLVDSNDNYKTHTATGIKLKSMIAIDCGEIEREFGRRQPGIDCNVITSPEEALRRVLGRKSLLQSSGFDEWEDLIAAELAITQKITLPKSDYLPDGASVWYARDEELDCTTSECFGKSQCNTRGILRQWMNKIECFEGSNRVTDVLMSCDTWEEFLQGKDMQECIKSFNPQLFLDNQLISQITNQPLIDPAGVTQVWTSPEGIRFWKVNLKKKFCTETGEIEKCDLFPDNYLLGLDLSNSRCSYSPIWGYTPITDVKHLTGGGQTVQTRLASRFVKNTCTFEPAGWKQVMQSNVLPFIPYPNGSTSLTLCSAKTEEAFTAPAPKAPVAEAPAPVAEVEAVNQKAKAKKEASKGVK